METPRLARDQFGSRLVEPPRSILRSLLGFVLAASVLSPVVVFFGIWPHGPGVEVLLAFAVPAIVAGLVSPVVWPDLARRRAVGRACIALLAWLPGIFVVFTLGFSLCSSDGTTTYVSQNELHATAALAVLVYLALGSFAVLRTRDVTIAWAAAIFTSLMLLLALLALFGGGPHHCYT